MNYCNNFRGIYRVLVLTLLIFVTPVFLGIALADDLSSASGEELRKISQGGILYDKWWKALGADAPEETHSAYTTQGKKKGSTTWRCKECHGWDYKGEKGAYRKGSHFSGISGIRNMAGASEQDIVAVLKDDTHKLGGVIPQAAMEKLAAFVSRGQIDNDDFITRDKKVKGNLANGERFYQTICAVCHGADGSEINFGSKDEPKSVGSVARSNPWETLHKMRMGQPGEEMPSMLAFKTQDVIDVLAYILTLSGEDTGH